MNKNEEITVIKKLSNLPSDPKFYNWTEISKLDLSDSFIIKYTKYLSWWVLSTKKHLSERIVKKFYKKINWEEFTLRKDIDINFLLKFPEYVEWDILVSREDFTVEMIEKYIDRYSKREWTVISYCRTDLPLNFYQKFKDKIDWNAFFCSLCDISKKKLVYDSVHNILTDDVKEIFQNIWNEKE